MEASSSGVAATWETADLKSRWLDNQTAAQDVDVSGAWSDHLEARRHEKWPTLLPYASWFQPPDGEQAESDDNESLFSTSNPGTEFRAEIPRMALPHYGPGNWEQNPHYLKCVQEFDHQATRMGDPPPMPPPTVLPEDIYLN